jgi:hypothetical protein
MGGGMLAAGAALALTVLATARAEARGSTVRFSAPTADRLAPAPH